MKKLVLFSICFTLMFSGVFYGCGASAVNPPFIENGSEDGSHAPSPPKEDDVPTKPMPDGEDEPPPPTLPEEDDVPPNPEPDEEQPPENPLPKGDILVRCEVSRLNIRKSASANSEVLGVMDYGDMLSYVKKEGSWYQVQYAYGVAYVSAAHAQTIAHEKSDLLIENVIAVGKTLMGLPYVYGAQRYHWGNGNKNTLFTGKSYDCSSLTQYIFYQGANVLLETTSRAQSVQGKAVTYANIRRGDLLFFTNSSRAHLTGIERIGHVALYLGNNTILHTASDYAVIEPISETRKGYFINARRLIF